MSARVRAHFELIRAPNLFTAAADVAASYLYVGGALADPFGFCLLIAASMSLYAGGVALNDVCDVAQDARERPRRPIPAGRVPRRDAALFSSGLLLGGWILAAAVSRRAALIAAALVAAIVLYDAVLKRTAAGPAMMGVCRALNLLLGMSAVESIVSVRVLFPVSLTWLYVASVTFFARTEATVSSRSRLLAGTIGVCAAAAGLTGLRWILPTADPIYLPFVGVLAAWLARRGWEAFRHPEPRYVQAAVKTFVVSLIMFDACLTMAARGPILSLCVAALLAPTLLLGRAFRVT